MRRCAAILVLLCLAACTGAGVGDTSPVAPRFQTLRHRTGGPRLPAFSGEDPIARGWVKVDDLIWVEQEHAEKVAQGLVFDGTRYVSVAGGLPAGVAATAGYRMRTDHVAVLTNLPWAQALEVARAAETHVVRFFEKYGERLDIRFPDGPLPVVVTARRKELVEILSTRTTGHVSWAAFYDTGEGAVYVSKDPPPAGALPWIADLRHEMTHQILDLARPLSRRQRAFGAGWFWLWEGIAIHSETLGDGPTEDHGHLRIERFDRRRARDGITPLARLLELGVVQFEGRHYDQTAALMRFLLATDSTYREPTLDAVRDLLRRPVSAQERDARLGASTSTIERSWLSTLAR